MRFIFFFLLILGCISCDRQEIVIEEALLKSTVSYPGVKEEFWPYFQRFETEAYNRGKEINLVKESITGILVPSTGAPHVAGTCYYNENKPGEIAIDSAIWNQATNLAQELIVFHELGHCSLFREHDDSINHDGTCKSIMKGSTSPCLLLYNLSTRNQYLDELFAGK